METASRRQKWIDQAQSLNIYMAGASGKKLDDTYKLAWVRGPQDHVLPAAHKALRTEMSTVKHVSSTQCRRGQKAYRPTPLKGPAAHASQCSACQHRARHRRQIHIH